MNRSSTEFEGPSASEYTNWRDCVFDSCSGYQTYSKPRKQRTWEWLYRRAFQTANLSTGKCQNDDERRVNEQRNSGAARRPALECDTSGACLYVNNHVIYTYVEGGCDYLAFGNGKWLPTTKEVLDLYLASEVMKILLVKDHTRKWKESFHAKIIESTCATLAVGQFNWRRRRRRRRKWWTKKIQKCGLAKFRKSL